MTAMTLEERIDYLLSRERNGWDHLLACVERGDLATYRRHYPAWEKLVEALADADDERRALLGLPVFESARNLSRRRDFAVSAAPEKGEQGALL